MQNHHKETKKGLKWVQTTWWSYLPGLLCVSFSLGMLLFARGCFACLCQRAPFSPHHPSMHYGNLLLSLLHLLCLHICIYSIRVLAEPLTPARAQKCALNWSGVSQQVVPTPAVNTPSLRYITGVTLPTNTFVVAVELCGHRVNQEEISNAASVL